jgi:hypothetical protein
MASFRDQVRDAMVSALIEANTAAGTKVYAPKNWPETPQQLPVLIVSIPTEQKQSWGPNGPKFTTTAHIVVLGRVTGSTAMDAEAQLDILAVQVQNAILLNLNVYALVQNFSTIQTQISITDQGELQIGEISVDFAAEFPEVFAPGVGPLVSIGGTIATPGTDQLLFGAQPP